MVIFVTNIQKGAGDVPDDPMLKTMFKHGDMNELLIRSMLLIN
jgi:hypothetical protein